MRFRIPLAFVFLVSLFVLTLATGLIGWSRHYANQPDHDLGDVIYHTLLAFVGDGSYLRSDIAPSAERFVDFARFSGLLTTISAALGLAVVFLREQITRLRAMTRKDHIVFIGASNFALDRYRNKGAITVFDTPENLDRLVVDRPTSQLLRIPDPMTVDAGIGLTLGKPKLVVFGGPDAVTNVERAQVWISARVGTKDTKVALRIEDSAISRDLQLLSEDFRTVEIFSRSDAIARALVTGMAPNSLAVLRGHARVHIVLVGLGSINLAVAEEMAMRCHHPRLAPLRITVLDIDPERAKSRIKSERPAFFNPDAKDHFELTFMKMDALECCADGAATELVEFEAANPITGIIVAAGEDHRNVAIATRLRQFQQERLCLRAPIFMRSDSLASISPRALSDLTGGIAPFGGRSLSKEDIELDVLYEKLAQTIHERWLASPDVVVTDDKQWTQLSNTDKRASYRAALSAIEMYQAAGFVPPIGSELAGLRVHPGAGNSLIGDPATILSLSKTEHERWNVERLLDGWQKTDTYRDNEKKKHPLIAPFENIVAMGARHEDKDERNVKASFSEGIAQHELMPASGCWRRGLRVGVIGPLEVDETRVAGAVAAALSDLARRRPEIADYSLEILTPNAPGFDRIAAISLAKAWLNMTGRPARLLSFNAASVELIDEIAAQHVAASSASDVIGKFERQTEQFMGLVQDGHLLRSLDCRPLSVSDADLAQDPKLYAGCIERVQNRMLALADEMFFAEATGAKWTQRAMQTWQRLDKAPTIVV